MGNESCTQFWIQCAHTLLGPAVQKIRSPEKEEQRRKHSLRSGSLLEMLSNEEQKQGLQPKESMSTAQTFVLHVVGTQ